MSTHRSFELSNYMYFMIREEKVVDKYNLGKS